MTAIALLLLLQLCRLPAAAEDKAPPPAEEGAGPGDDDRREAADVKKIALPPEWSRARTLEVPYYGQGGSLWCWAASLAMLEGYHGLPDKTWEIGSHFGVDVKGIKFLYRDLRVYLQGRHGATAEYETYYDIAELDDALRKSLDQGVPVWLGLPSAGHAVVAVGYDKDRLYVHDPVGKLVGKAEDFSVPETQWRGILDGKLAAYGLLWERWENALRRLTSTDRASDYFIGSVQPVAKFLRITSPAPSPKPLSIQLYPHAPVDSRGMELAHFGMNAYSREWRKFEDVAFEWQGSPPGVSYTHLSTVRVRTPAVCNSDRIVSFKPFVSNSSLERRSFTVRALLDGDVLAEAKGVVDPKTTDRPVELRKPDALLALDRHPLSLGEHRLLFELLEGDRVADQVELPFPVAPAPVAGLKVRRTASDLLELAWKPNAEPGVQYQVMSTPGMSLDYGKLHGTTGETKFTVRLEGNEKRGWNKMYYSLWAVDPASDLTSQEADFVKAQNAPEECADLDPAGKSLEKGQYYAALSKYQKCLEEGREALDAPAEPGGTTRQPGLPQEDPVKRACIDCVNGLITGDCYVRVATMAGWGLCLSCSKDGGVEEGNRFVDKNKCPACEKVRWDLCDFKPAPKGCMTVCKPAGSCPKRDGN